MTRTTRAALLISAIACSACAAPAAQAPAVPQPAAAAASTPPVRICRCMRLCFVQKGRLVEIDIVWNPATGDTMTVDSLPITQVAPLTGEYASVAGWYVNQDTITLRGRPFRRYGMERELGINEVEKVGEYRGVGVYGEAGHPQAAMSVVYLPTRPGCQFQPYEDVDSMAAWTRERASSNPER
jgi:hypothetical protein